MKIIANIFFEKLHRYVYDYCLQSSNPHWGWRVPYKIANFHNKKEEWNECIVKVYDKLCPYFLGWRMSLKINLWWVKKYRRYEPKKLVLYDYEFDRLSRWNKFIYSIRYEWSKKI